MKKRIVLLFVFAAIFFGCKKNAVDSGKSVIGKWKLTETQFSIAGIGDWKVEDSNNPRFITFNANGSFSATGNLFQGVDSYSINTDSTKINFYRSAVPDTSMMTYTIQSGLLTLRPPCIEPCGLRFVKAE